VIKREDSIPKFLVSPYPYRERARTNGIYGVTEVLYCLRKSVLARVVPAPTALTSQTRKVFARGHALEAVFFGDIQNPIHFRGGVVEGRDFSKIEGHTDHSTVNEDGESTIVEFKTTKHLWLKGPDGKSYYSLKSARTALPKEQWKDVEREPSKSHMDQLMFYMLLNNAKHGYLIYHEMSTDMNYTWSLDYEDIPESFKDEMKTRLDALDGAFINDLVPDKCPKYDFECKLCNMSKNGLCQLCDVKDFNLGDFIQDFKSRNNPMEFMPVIKEYYDRYGLDSSELKFVSEDADTNGKAKENGS
jgi:hypothetical protein